MSDKSFGDCANRNIVKNPLLSTAVTGLSIEDLTHNAVLVPVAASQGLVTRSDPQIPIETLAASEHEFTNFPSGDSNTNVFSLQNTPLHSPDPTIPYNKTEVPPSTVSKASLKSEDDFDVNEYFARLQGTRYVSAPINSNPDQNANLGAEENLEEINLNDDKTGAVQQSLTADIAQNFSQLPTVLPHVASAVFSSFTNMLNYKSREQTPDDRGHQEVSFQSPAPGANAAPGFVGQNVYTPMMAEDTVKEVAPPPKEPPVYGASNFRITTKKKYAQIPGLSSGHNLETAQKIELNPLTKNITGYFIPTNDEKPSVAPVDTKPQELDHSKEITRQNIQETYNIFNPIDSDFKASDSQPSAFVMPTENEPNPFEERLPPPPISFASQTNTGNNTIPPPPMFSTQRRDSSSSSGKSVLPPSVARRIGSNQPVMKPKAMQSINTDNIFVPTFDATTVPTQPIGSFSDIHSQSPFVAQTLVTNPPTSQKLREEIQTSVSPSIQSIPPHSSFIPQPPPGFGTQPLAPPTSVIAPPSKVQTQKLASPPTKILDSNVQASPMLPPTLPSIAPTMFAPYNASVADKTYAIPEPVPPYSSIFSPTLQVGASAISPPAKTQPTGIGSIPNAELTPFFTPPSTAKATPLLFNPGIGQEPPKPSQAMASEPPKSLIEPPKSIGAVNFRMNKKKPQYYSGPIEGVGSISNSIKPIMQPVDSGTFQGALFTPEVPQVEHNVQSSIPFDISKQGETVPLNPQLSSTNPPANTQLSTSFDIGQSAPVYSHFDITNPVQDNNQYCTAFDLSRSTTDSYAQEEPKESKGFGIIGSLKSKLSSIDINKIQNTVTTFFDPAYNDTSKDGSTAQENVPYSNVSYSNIPYQSQSPETNLEIFVQNAPQNTQASHYEYQQQVYRNNEYYKYPNFQNQGQPSAGHCSNEINYPSLYGQPYQNPVYSEIPTNSTMNQQPLINVPVQGVTDTVSLNSPVKSEDYIPKTTDNQESNIDRQLNENITRFEPEATQIIAKSSIDKESIKSYKEIEPANLQMSVDNQTIDLTATRKAAVSDEAQNRSVSSDYFEKVQESQEPRPDHMSMFDPITVDLFSKMAIKEDNNENANMYPKKSFDEKEKPRDTNIPKYGAHNVELFANITSNNEKTDDHTTKLLSTLPVDIKEQKTNPHDEVKTHNLFASTVFDNKEVMIPKDGLLESLTKDDVPILGVSSVPLFGLSTIIADKSKEYTQSNDLVTTVDRNSSLSFFDHPLKSEDPSSKRGDTLNRNASFSFFDNTSGQQHEGRDQNKKLDMTGKTSTTFTGNAGACSHIQKLDTTENKGVVLDRDEEKRVTGEIGTENVDDASESELSICETCREVNKPEDKGDEQDVTTQLIGNITAPIQLSNAVEAPLPESALLETNNPDQAELDAGQYDEISHITEETIETIQVQSATELLEDVDEIKSMNYGWAESALKEDYNFQIDPNAIGFYGSNSLFFDKVPTNTEEIKHHEDMLTRQMSVPSAPPAEEDEEDSKSDEAGVLDVHSIEQDANKDFPLFEEFVIEPSDADDDLKEKETDLDSFTDRVEKYKNLEPSESEPPQGLFFDLPPAPVSMVSYFDTGNYAVESHYRNMRPTPQTISIPPGFEEEYKRRLALAKERVEKFKNEIISIPDTSTQTRTTTVTSYTTSRIPLLYTCSEGPGLVGFNVEANITSLVDEQSEQLSQESLSSPIPPFDNLMEAQNKTPPKSLYGNIPEKSEEKQESKLFKFTPAFNAKSAEKPDSNLSELSSAFSLKPNEKLESSTAFNLSQTEDVPKLRELSSAFGVTPAEKYDSKLPDFPATFNLKPVVKQASKSPELPSTFNLKPEKEQNLPAFSTAFAPKPELQTEPISPELPIASNFKVEEPNLPEKVSASISKPELNPQAKLPDPINFFANTTPQNPPETFNRLASYFSSPPKTDHAKSFFELSQSQNHYRHASTEQKTKIGELINDLTSPQNITVTKEQTIRHVNYFTVEYDTVLPELNKGDLCKDKLENEDDKIDLNSLVTNCRYCTKIFDSTFKVRAAMNDNSEAGTAPKMEPRKEAGRGSITVNFDGLALLEETNEGVAGLSESRPATEYTPVKHHWFYRVDVEDKSIWRGFSVVDSRALEAAYLSSDLNDKTVVATDGGRYDVNVMGRLRIPVYWSDKPTNVRRCSWFYKGTTDARYVPYTEPVAEKLEEEYRHGMTTGEWHRRLVIPNGEVVVMHGPSVMVHFLHSDAFSTPPQSSSRPRVVRRGHDESEIEDTEPSSIDHLLLLCHGVGSACDMRFRSVEEVVEDFRATSLQLIQSHYRNSYDQGIVSRVEVLPISWHATLHSGETGVDRRLSQITLDSIPRLRSFTNDTVLDVLFYTSPVFCQTIVDTVCKELNRIYDLFVKRNPSFKGGISLGGHSLGSVILYDLLCHQIDATDAEKLPAEKNYVQGPAGTGQPSVRYPRLTFAPAALYALGSPIAIFECIRGVESLGASFSLPTCKKFFNIFHPYDPIAYRIEPLIDSRLRDLKPFLIPHHKGRKRMHLELKDTMARVGADLKQKLMESLKSTWNKWKAPPPTDGQLEKVVEEEMEKEQLCDSNKEEYANESELSTPEILGRLNGGRRVDYVLQEAPLEMINEYLFAMSSHVGYWESEDTMLLMLREIYSALGVQPDSTVPQQNMTVQRTRNSKQDDTFILNASEFPSTSHGPI